MSLNSYKDNQRQINDVFDKLNNDQIVWEVLTLILLIVCFFKGGFLVNGTVEDERINLYSSVVAFSPTLGHSNLRLYAACSIELYAQQEPLNSPRKFRGRE